MPLLPPVLHHTRQCHGQCASACAALLSLLRTERHAPSQELRRKRHRGARDPHVCLASRRLPLRQAWRACDLVLQDTGSTGTHTRWSPNRCSSVVMVRQPVIARRMLRQRLHQEMALPVAACAALTALTPSLQRAPLHAWRFSVPLSGQSAP